jgi:hypothetical protein
MKSKRLSKDGYRLRESIAEAGVEITPDELADGIDDAINRISGGPCSVCGETKECRYGMCFDCCFQEDTP